MGVMDDVGALFLVPLRRMCVAMAREEVSVSTGPHVTRPTPFEFLSAQEHLLLFPKESVVFLFINRLDRSFV